MPITRRKRANPPEEPENTTNHLAEQTASPNPKEAPAGEQTITRPGTEDTTVVAPGKEQAVPPSAVPAIPTTPIVPTPTQPFTPVVPSAQSLPTNGDRDERVGQVGQVGNGNMPVIESGRRTARGELFRRPPQPPVVPPTPPPVPVVAQAPLQAATHEITLPLGNLLHLAYNPGYTGSDDARSVLLQKLARESKAGGRARCWNCGAVAIVYDCWNTRSKTFGEVGIAFCEICGVWSVL
jgi:hypothetical protein